MEYEVIREIFNQCSNNQMRDVHVEEVDIASPEQYMARLRSGKVVDERCYEQPDGDVVYELECDGLRQRVSFTRI